MILTTASEQTKRLTDEQVKLLRDECDDVTARMEAGWLIVIGYKGDKRLVLAHCDSQQDYEMKMGIFRPSRYGNDGSGYAFSATATYEKEGQVTGTQVFYFCHVTRYLNDIADEVRALADENLREVREGEDRKITFATVYWDDIPRNSQVLTLERSNTPTP
ncbi:hypothetical protein [Rhizobium sp. MHM7A]|uniref:hypothetical protein n=1 Tax=Rhizobium sp. MHM7A TaxID=2583233 RepID=UPI0011067560|nr:hypothetical protein [Rhizobium sp. MHM7A]TLX15874.1 hypothetical protein FFR93_00740 [Rhizobium sp. MHM7A]